MDFRIIWSPEAVEDLEAIADYIGRDSDYYAQAVVTKVLDMSRTVKNLPMVGRVVPEIGQKNIRECFIHSYRMVYRIGDKDILIAAIIHGRRLLKDIAERLSDST